MQVRLIACAESSATDQHRNTVSLFHILEELNSPAFPTIVPQCVLVTLFVREPAEPSRPEGVGVRVYLGTEVILEGPMDLDFQGHMRLRYTTSVQNLILSAPGTLRFSIVQNGRELGVWPMVVNHIGQPVLQSQLPLTN